MNLKLSPRDELILGVVAIILVAVLVVVFLIYPQVQQRGELITKQEGMQRQVLDAEATLSRLKEAKAQSVANQAELIKIANQIPDQPELPTLIVEMQDVANQAGVDFVSITPGKPAPAGNLQTINLAISVNGQFRDVVDFLSRLASMQREVRVLSITVSVQTYPQLGLDLKANTFVMGSPTTATQGGTPSSSSGGAR